MKKAIVVSIIIITAILIIRSNKDDRQINLGSGYYYIPFQEVIFDVTGFGGNGIYLCKDGLKVPIIFSDVENYAYDSSFIIIKQKFDFNTKYLLESMIFMPDLYFDYDKDFVFLDEKYVQKDNSIKSVSEREKYIEKIMNEDRRLKLIIENGVNYYIIDKKNNKIFGPSKHIEFEDLKSKMGISLDF